MKKLIFILFNMILYFPTFSQLKADAGDDIIVCQDDENEYIIGGSPTASGGVGPYSYNWSGKFYDLKYPSGELMWIYASDFLDDTTKSNPTIKEWRNVPEEWTTLYLKVEDAAGNIYYDSARVIQSLFSIRAIYILPKTIQRGDSVRFFGDSYFISNFPPLTYTITPTHGLSDPTDIYGWAKPDTSTTYYLQAVNAAGCTSSKIKYLHIDVKDQQHEWAPIGAKWHYTAPGTGLCVQMHSTGNTFINGLKFRTVEFRYCGANEIFCREYFYQNGDSIFYYNYYHKSKYLLYNFAAKTGDSVIVHNDPFKVTEIFRLAQYSQDTLNYFKYHIDDVDSVMISGTWLKRQKISTLGNSEIGFYPSFAYLIEKLGSDLFPIGRPIAIPTGETFQKGQLRCYSDDKTNYVHPNWNHACDYMLSQSANLLMKDIVHLFPNPVVHNYLSITAPSIIKRVVFYNLHGVKVYEAYPLAQNPTINLSLLTKGIYLVEITMTDKDNPVVKKIIKQ